MFCSYVDLTSRSGGSLAEICAGVRRSRMRDHAGKACELNTTGSSITMICNLSKI